MNCAFLPILEFHGYFFWGLSLTFKKQSDEKSCTGTVFTSIGVSGGYYSVSASRWHSNLEELCKKWVVLISRSHEWLPWVYNLGRIQVKFLSIDSRRLTVTGCVIRYRYTVPVPRRDWICEVLPIFWEDTGYGIYFLTSYQCCGAEIIYFWLHLCP